MRKIVLNLLHLETFNKDIVLASVFVTGATGFIGSHLVDELLKKNYKIKCLVRKTSNLRWLEGKPVEYVYGGLFDNDVLSEAVKDVDYVYHIAGVTFAKKISKETLKLQKIFLKYVTRLIPN